MLERLRHDRRWALGALLGFALVLAVALLANVQTHRALHGVEVCSSAPGDPAAALASHTADAAAAAHPDGHASDPGCVLCLALSTPPGAPVWAYRPPSAHARALWHPPQPRRARRDTAPPPPLRGPPEPERT